jgi:hypothetical protein
MLTEFLKCLDGWFWVDIVVPSSKEVPVNEQRNIAFTQQQAGFVAPVPTSDGGAANVNRQPLDP